MTYERPLPYIGVSGVNNAEQGTSQPRMQDRLLEYAEQAGLSPYTQRRPRQLLMGVKAVHKTQFLDIENRHGRQWYPVGADEFAHALDGTQPPNIKAAQIFFDPNLVHSAEYRDAFMQRIRERGTAWLNAYQFDLLPWHDNDEMLTFITRLKEETGHTVILQAHGPAMTALGPEGMTARLSVVADAVDYVLFDASHGKGVRLNPDALSPFLDAFYTAPSLATMNAGVAGGLYAPVVWEDVPALLQHYPDLSWDAEGKIHHPATEDGISFDDAAAYDYLQASAAVLGAHRGGDV